MASIFGPGNPEVSDELIRKIINTPGITGDRVLQAMQNSGVSLSQVRDAVGDSVDLSDARVLPFLQSRGITPPPVQAQAPLQISAPVAVPQTGLIGSEQALQAGLTGSLQALQEAIERSNALLSQTQGGVTDQIQSGQDLLKGAIGDNAEVVDRAISQGAIDTDAAMAAANKATREGVSALQPFVNTGMASFNQVAALLGALGPSAQRSAQRNFQSSPGQQFLRDQGEQSIIRNAAALGGTGGSNVLRALQEFGTGLASQDFGNQLNRLNNLGQLGFQGAGTQANLFSNLAGINADLLSQRAGLNANLPLQFAGINANLAGQGANLAGQGAGILSGIGRQGSEQVFNAGINASNQALNTGGALASGRTRAGELLADLSSQQGSGVANIINQSSGNLANLLQGAGSDQATSAQQLAQLLAGIASSQGSQAAGLPGIPGIQNQQGILPAIGQAAGGIGTMLAAI